MTLIEILFLPFSRVQDIAMDDVREVEPEMVPSDPIPQDNDEMMQIDSEPEYSKTQTTITQPGEDKLGIISDETVLGGAPRLC